MLMQVASGSGLTACVLLSGFLGCLLFRMECKFPIPFTM